MKPVYLFFILLAFVLPIKTIAQLANGNVNANFGVDADTKSNYVKYGPATGSIVSDDWFSPAGIGNNIIDTAGANTYLSMLQAGVNLSFNKRMSSLLYSKISGKLA